MNKAIFILACSFLLGASLNVTKANDRDHPPKVSTIKAHEATCSVAIVKPFEFEPCLVQIIETAAPVAPVCIIVDQSAISITIINRIDTGPQERVRSIIQGDCNIQNFNNAKYRPPKEQKTRYVLSCFVST